MPHDRDNFTTTFDTVSNRSKNATNAANLVSETAHRLAERFSERGDVPKRLQRRPGSSDQVKKTTVDSGVEKRFQENVHQWKQLIDTMLAKISPPLAWRVLKLSPQIEGKLHSVTDCQDFRCLVDYLILRRDKECCDANEVGWLARLSVAFQREIEKQIQPGA